MVNITWENNHICVSPVRRPKKITGTRFASILGVNRWATPFEAWCAITRAYEKPFEDTIYTLAGKAIEPKQAEYMENMYGMTIVRPSDIWGEDYFQQTYGDFFHDRDIFGGMWDYLMRDENGNISAVLEMKTTKRVEDWETDIPEYYALQAALYAYLLNVEHVVMVCSFLDESDYTNYTAFVPSAKNTITIEFDVHTRYRNFDDLIQKATDWWEDHVLTGISPAFDEKKDAEILSALRTKTLTPDTNISSLVDEAERLKDKIDGAYNAISAEEKRLKELNDLIKKYALSKFTANTKKIEVPGKSHIWTLSKSISSTLDKAAMKADGVLDKYTVPTENYRLTVK